MYVLEYIEDHGYEGTLNVSLAVSKDIELLKAFAIDHRLGAKVFDEKWRVEDTKIILSFQEYKMFCITPIKELIKE